jgi:hypothetical protein
VDAGARFGQVVRTQGVQGVFNAGSRVIQRTPLAAVNTAGQYAGNVIRARQLPTPQQYMNAGANIYRQTPLRPVVDAGARVGQVVRTQGVQGVFNAGSRVIQRTPLAAVNTAGRFTGNVIRSRTLPTPQQYMNAGATIFRQTPLAPVVNAGQRVRQQAPGIIAAGNRAFQASPLAAVNTAGRFTGNVIRARQLPTPQQAFNAGATVFRQTPLAPAVNAGAIFRTQGAPGIVAAGNRAFQRSPLAAYNTAGQFAGNVLRSGTLPTRQQVLNAGATIFRQTPLAPVVRAGQGFQAWGGLNRLNPVPSARGAEITPIGSGSSVSPDGRSGSWWNAYAWQNPTQRSSWSTSGSWQQPTQSGSWGGSGAWSWQTPQQSGSWQTSGGNSWTTQGGSGQTGGSPEADTDVLGHLGRLDVIGALGAAGNAIGGLRPNAGAVSGGQPQWNNQSWQSSATGPNGQTATTWGTSSNWTSQAQTGPAARTSDGSMDFWGKLFKGDVVGAADAGVNWITNVPMNQVNLAAGRLERQEFPLAKAYDDWLMDGHQKQLARLGPEPAKDSPNHLAWQMNRNQMGDGTAGSFKGLGGWARDWNSMLLGTIGTGVLLGAASVATTAGKAGGQLWNRDVGGAIGTVGEAGANAAIGTAQWGVGLPGRYIADPKHAGMQIAGEFIAGDILVGGAVRGIRGAKGATVQTIGRPLGLFNPDVLVTKGKIGVPQDAPVRQVESILSNPYSFNVIHTSRQPLSLNPIRGKIFAEAGEGATVPKQFFTSGNKRTGVTSDIFYTRKLKDLPLSVRASNFAFGPRINLVPQMRNVQLPGGLQRAALSEVRTRGALTEGTYRRIESHAMEQSIRYGEPIFMPSPKRMKPQISRIENEGIAVFGNDAARTITAHQFGGYTAGGVKVSRVAFGNQVLPTGRLGYMAKNARSSFDYGFSRSAGARSLGLYHQPSTAYRAELANYKIDVLTGRKQVSPAEAQFDGRGRQHFADVQEGLAWERRINPVVRNNLSPAGARVLALTEDAGKFWQQDPMYPSGRLAAIGLERGLFPAVAKDFSRLTKPEQRAITRALVQHNAISPAGVFSWAGIRTKVIGPDAVGMALFNANQAPGAATFASGRVQARGMGSRVFSGQFGFIEPGLSRIMTWEKQRAHRSDLAPWLESPPGTRGAGLGKTVEGLRARGRKGIGDGEASFLPDRPGYRRSSRYGAMVPQARASSDPWTGTDLEPWMRPPKPTADLLHGRTRAKTYEPRRAGGSVLSGSGRGSGSAAYPLSRGYVSGALVSGPSPISYGSEKPSYGRSYAPGYGAVTESFGNYGSDLYGKATKYGGGYRDGYAYGGGEYAGYGGDRYTYGGGYRYGGGGYGGGYSGYGYGGRYSYGDGGYSGYGYGGRYSYGGGGYSGYGYGGRYTYGGGGYGGYGYGGRYTYGGGGNYISTGEIITTGGGGNITTGGWFTRTRTGQPWERPNQPEEEQKGRRGGGRAAYDFMEGLGIDDPESILSRGGRAVRRKGKGGKGLMFKLPSFSPIKAPKAKKGGFTKPRARVTRSTRRRRK